MKIEEEVRQKKPYEKPRLRTIELAAQEVLAGNCKIAAFATGPVGVCTGGMAPKCINSQKLGS